MVDNPPPSQDERSAWEAPEQTRLSSKPQLEIQEPWERDVLARLVYSIVEEKRRARRWGIFFKSLIFIYLFLLFWISQGGSIGNGHFMDVEHTALIDIHGVLADDAEANAKDIIDALHAAYESKHTKGIILRINSPGGSPVEAGYVNDEIRRMRKKYPAIPVYAVVTDMCASGGYYIAVAADKIYVNKASIVGSIGVRMSGLSTFGFVGTMKKLGIERRMLAAGRDKAMLDPFSPLKEDEVKHVRGLLDNIHQQFIKVVKEGRGNRLKGADDELFNGLFWTGEQGIALGLADGFGTTDSVARNVIGAEKIVDYTHHPAPWEQFTDRLGVAMVQGFSSVFGLASAHLQ